MKRMKSWHAVALLALTVSAVAFWGFEKGENRDFQIAKNLVLLERTYPHG